MQHILSNLSFAQLKNITSKQTKSVSPSMRVMKDTESLRDAISKLKPDHKQRRLPPMAFSKDKIPSLKNN